MDNNINGKANENVANQTNTSRIPTILHLNGRYIDNIDTLRKLLRDTQLVHKDSFRNELLSAYRDSVIDSWFADKCIPIRMNPDARFKQDNELFKALYQAITNESPDFNLDSSFSKHGELLRCEYHNNKYLIEGGTLMLPLMCEQGESEIKFVFRSISPENNTHVFEIQNESGVSYGQVESDWSDKTKGKEYSVTFTISSSCPSQELLLKEYTLGASSNADSLIVKIYIYTNPQKIILKTDDGNINFYYVESANFYIGNYRCGQCKYGTIEKFISQHPKLELSFPHGYGIRQALRGEKWWYKLPHFIWLEKENNQYKYYNTATGNVGFCGSEDSTNAAWLICKNLLQYSKIEVVNSKEQWICDERKYGIMSAAVRKIMIDGF